MKIIEIIMFDHFRFVNRIDQYAVKQNISMRLINNRKRKMENSLRSYLLLIEERFHLPTSKI